MGYQFWGTSTFLQLWQVSCFLLKEKRLRPGTTLMCFLILIECHHKYVCFEDSVIYFIASLNSVLVIKNSHLMKQAMGLHGLCALFAAVVMFSVCYSYFLMPETYGLSLEEVQKLYKPVKVHHSCQFFSVPNVLLQFENRLQVELCEGKLRSLVP